MFSHGTTLVSVCDGLVVVGWLGRVSTTLHCTHHVLTPISRHLSVFFFFDPLMFPRCLGPEQDKTCFP